MSKCFPIDREGLTEFENDLQRLKSPPDGHRVVIAPNKPLGSQSAFLVDSSVTDYQGDGLYCVQFPVGAEMVKRICKADSGFLLAADAQSGLKDEFHKNLTGCITGKAVQSLTLY